MSSSTTHLDLVSSSQSQKEVTVNGNMNAASPAFLYALRLSTTVGLTWGFYGGVKQVAGVPTVIANGTIALTASATNYLYATSAGVVTKATSPPASWPGPLASSAIALYEIVTGTATVTSYIDYRLAGAGEVGPTGSTGATGPPGSGGVDFENKHISFTSFGNVFGTSSHGATIATTGASAGNVALTGASYFHGLHKFGYEAASSAINQNSGYNWPAAEYFRSNVAGVGGFKIILIYALGAVNSDSRVGTGIAVQAVTALPGVTTEPSALLNCVILAADSSDTNLQLMHNDGSGACTKIDLGASFPPRVASTDVYRVTLEHVANAATISYVVDRQNTGGTTSGTLSTDLPAVNTIMAPFIYVNTGPTQTTKSRVYGARAIFTSGQ